jgi:hypothetical protein
MQKQKRLTTQQAWFQGLMFLVYEMNPGYDCDEWAKTHRDDLSVSLLADTFGTTPSHVVNVVVSLKDLLSRIERDYPGDLRVKASDLETIAQTLPKFKRLVNLSRARKQRQ